LTEQDDASTEPATLAEKLDFLFRTVRTPGGREFSHEDVARAIGQAEDGPTISATYIWQLRRGQRTNPRMSHLHALARFFGVDPGYFFPVELAEQMEADLAEASPVLRDADVRALAAAALGLTPPTIGVVRGLVEHLRTLEGLDQPATA
jgi:transcriptional regulator with XRE-family HTH domain